MVTHIFLKILLYSLLASSITVEKSECHFVFYSLLLLFRRF